jgi:hypothetical protein
VKVSIQIGLEAAIIYERPKSPHYCQINLQIFKEWRMIIVGFFFTRLKNSKNRDFTGFSQLNLAFK